MNLRPLPQCHTVDRTHTRADFSTKGQTLDYLCAQGTTGSRSKVVLTNSAWKTWAEKERPFGIKFTRWAKVHETKREMKKTICRKPGAWNQKLSTLHCGKLRNKPGESEGRWSWGQNGRIWRHKSEGWRKARVRQLLHSWLRNLNFVYLYSCIA